MQVTTAAMSSWGQDHVMHDQVNRQHSFIVLFTEAFHSFTEMSLVLPHSLLPLLWCHLIPVWDGGRGCYRCPFHSWAFSHLFSVFWPVMTIYVKCCTLFLFLFVWQHISCSPDWPWTPSSPVSPCLSASVLASHQHILFECLGRYKKFFSDYQTGKVSRAYESLFWVGSWWMRGTLPWESVNPRGLVSQC